MRIIRSPVVPLFFFLTQTASAGSAPLRLEKTIPLPNVEGRIDHLSTDINGQRLFVAALGNITVEVIDLRAGRRSHSISGLSEPQGVAYVPSTNQIFVANGGDGSCKVFDGHSFKLIASLDFKDDADNLRYDAQAGLVYVGFGNGAIGTIDATELKQVGEVKLAGHPEAFQLEKNGNRIFVNVPTANQVAVIDRKKQTVIATWLVKEAHANFPMALDESNHRLFIGCRKPAQLLVFDTESGKEVGRLAIDGDADDIFYDSQHKQVYVVCGAGFIDVFQQVSADQYKPVARISTAPGARTGLFVPELGRLYIAIPHRENQKAEIRVYDVQPQRGLQSKMK